MKDIKYYLLILLLILSHSGICQIRPVETDCKRVPLIDYTPYNYTADLQGAMRGDDGIGYVEYCTDSIYAFFRHITYLPHRDKSPIKYVREIKVLDLTMTTGPIFDNFKKIVQTSDSTFFFSFFPNRLSIFDYDILGRYENGKLIFMDKDRVEFDNISDLIDHRFGSIDNFIKAYSDFQRRALLCDYKHNGLHDFRCAEDAIELLKNDYNFLLLYAPNTLDRAVELFVNQIDSIIPINDRKNELTDRIKTQINSVNPVEFSELLLRYRQKCEKIYLYEYCMDAVLKEFFDVEDYERVINGLTMRRAGTLAAYEYLGDTFKEEILSSGSGIMDNVSILNYLKKILHEEGKIIN